MRLVVGLILLLSIASCKKKVLLNKIEGTWQQTKILIEDGSYVPQNAVYEFGSGEVDEWLPLTIYSNDTTYLQYQPSSIQHKFSVKDTSNNTEILWIVEDIDKHSMVIRNLNGVLYFEKKN